MKIRDKLLFAFAIYVLLAAIIGFVAYKDLSTITNRLQLVQVADDITNTLLEIRRHEKNYLLFRDKDHIDLLNSFLANLKQNIDGIQREIILDIGNANYMEMKTSISSYEKRINEIVEIHRAQSDLARMVVAAGQRLQKELRDELLQRFIALRQLEKDFLLKKDSRSFKAFQESFSSMPQGDDLGRYGMLAERLHLLHTREAEIHNAIIEHARAIELFTTNLSAKERADVNAILALSRKLLVFALLTVLAVGVAINVKLAKSIVIPILSLEESTKRMAEGDFSVVNQIRGHDEIASLAQSFNDMGRQLNETMGSLELAVQNLHEKQRQLVEAEKLASLGTLAAGVAHEINNPLAIINEKAGLMQDIMELSKNVPRKDKYLDIIASILESVNRCRTITHRLLGFARGTETTIEIFDISTAVNDVIGFLGQEITAKKIRIQRFLDPHLPAVASDKAQLQQVLLNIIKNAIDAVEEGGVIIVSSLVDGDDAVKVVIADNGPGIPEDRIKRIFEPFFTTKEKGKGTGLGLSITYGIVRRLGGEITVESEVGRGTSFRIRIPLKIHAKKEI
ncbi:MAG: ATP-binding protein [Nitrospirota bacterium]|nr:ATP-binding protein [Nitrospirota bacterium]